jgi:hypothetical protein
MNKNCTMTQNQLRALLIDAFSKGRDFQRASHENGPISPETEKARGEWSAYLEKMCGNTYY